MNSGPLPLGCPLIPAIPVQYRVRRRFADGLASNPGWSVKALNMLLNKQSLPDRCGPAIVPLVNVAKT